MGEKEKVEGSKMDTFSEKLRENPADALRYAAEQLETWNKEATTSEEYMNVVGLAFVASMTSTVAIGGTNPSEGTMAIQLAGIVSQFSAYYDGDYKYSTGKVEHSTLIGPIIARGLKRTASYIENQGK